MARPTRTDVYLLAKSLSPKELAFCRKWLLAGAGEAALSYQLLQLITTRNKVTDEDAAKALGNPGKAHFSGLKTQLCNELADVLVMYRHNTNAGLQTGFRVARIEELLRRGLVAMALASCESALDDAIATEQFQACIHLSTLRQRILEEQDYKAYKASIGIYFEAQKKYSAHAAVLQQLQVLNDSLSHLEKETPLRYTNSQVAEATVLLDTLLLLYPSISDSRLLQVAYCCGQLAAYYLLQDYVAAVSLGKALMARLEKHHYLITTIPEIILQGCSMLFYVAFARKDLTAAADLLVRINALMQNLPAGSNHAMQWQVIAFNTRLKIAHKQTNYEAVAQYMQQKEKLLTMIAAALPPARQLAVLCSICISLFVLGRYQEAEDLLLTIRETNRTVDREDIFFFSSLFYLLILFEQGKWYQLDNTIEATYHVLYARKKLRPFEKNIMQFLKQLATHRSLRARIILVKDMLDTLQAYRSDPIHQLNFLYFDFYGWLESKAQGITYQQYRKQHAAMLVAE